MKKLLFLVPVLLLGLGWLFYRQKSVPPEAPFARVTRETLISTLATNGKVEPVEWVAILADRSGVVEAFHAEPGASVRRGAVLAELSAADARAELAAAEQRREQAKAALQILQRGGRASDLAAIEGETARVRMELDTAGKEQASLARLAGKQAATGQEVIEAGRRVQAAEIQLKELAGKRAALVDQSDQTAAKARLEETGTAVETARRHLEKAMIRAPIDGVVYDTQARLGSFLNPGDPVATVGRIDKVRVRVYVDEPELGGVAAGMQVAITWDALQGRRWQGTVEKLPSQITALGARQVGEVICVIDNPRRELLPGTNINAQIRSRVAEHVLAIPREALRREGGDPGVYVLQGDKIAWRKIAIGISSITRTEVLQGLTEGEAVALPTDAALTVGASVRPVFR